MGCDRLLLSSVESSVSTLSSDQSLCALRAAHTCATISAMAYPPTAPTTHGMGHSCQGRSQSSGIGHAPTHDPKTAPATREAHNTRSEQFGSTP